jgi:glycosyltransferase involved in cell wall biosynthesis
LWTTAYILLKVRNTARKFYLIQDFEPLFYPAGSTYAQAEMTYRFNFHAIANTVEMKRFYEEQYGGIAHVLTPQIDGAVFYPPATPPPVSPVRIFWYARPSNPRNGFELAANALRILKLKIGEGIEVVCAGSDWNPSDFGLDGIVKVLGLLSYEETAELYRTCHISLVMQMSRHPSYLPLEVMACGCIPIVNTNPATAWLLEHERNCLIAPASASGIAETLERAVREYPKLENLRTTGISEAKARSSWETELAGVAAFMVRPQ